MADGQPSSNEINEGGEGGDYVSNDETTTVIAENIKTTPIVDDYVDEPLEDYVVNLVVNEQPDSGITVSTKVVDAAIADMQDTSTPSNIAAITDKINEYTATVIDELSSSPTTDAITGGKRWWGWSTQKLIFVVLGKKFKKKPATSAGSTGTTKAVVTKGISPDPKYQPVPNV
ncbi:unnamed protein product [Rotaria sordida]|uniref:Uncharacterized protein n=1 Tax=Rotaria sordida TaxID=392033 RepID=A0A818NQ28_9BILA|nr:unnamed protein product [Rotaria sordida]CAF3608422.1 unnamed protein product [Rotaria sordida]